ncbi:MAG: 6-carboxytetrahydropterin synthase [Gammaproteobacteria bacterium]|nr:6-carboxytetrahydropterin synthase [Gammaproteobacteria bacterium]MCY4199712.1 6-carboxytetrahydropterin synthase [Gammaproteobacteria bacterium]
MIEHTGDTTLELAKESFHFSAAHFTLFSATSRERLHGHNYTVRCRVTCEVGGTGLAFDYTGLKQRLKDLCAALDEFTLLPANSPWLDACEADGQVVMKFDGDTFSLPASDVRLLPVQNITLEALAAYLVDVLLASEEVAMSKCSSLTIGVSSSPGIWAEATRAL